MAIVFIWIGKHMGDFLEFLPNSIFSTEGKLRIKGFGV